MAEAGFTLLEIIVALVVLGVLFATLSQGVRFGFRKLGAPGPGAAHAARRLSAVDRTLRRLVEQMDPGSERDGATLAGPRPCDGVHGAAAIRCGSPAPCGNPRRTCGCASRMAGCCCPGCRTVMRYGWGRFRRRRPPMLMDGIAGIDLGYWSDGAQHWSSSWTGNSLPDLVRIRIVFGEHDPRHWPDIVEAPVRAQVPG